MLHFFYEDDLFEKSELKEEKRPVLLRDPNIIHYAAHPKPWHPACTHPERMRFLRYLRESGWFSPSEYTLWRLQMEGHRLTLKGQEAWQTVKDLESPGFETEDT